jgi:hypothetical protein
VQFRQRALARLRSPEELDMPIRLARPRGWLILAALAAVVVAGGVWSVVGGLPHDLAAPGILTYPEGSFSLQSPIAGQVVDVFVHEGDGVAFGSPVLNVQTGSGVQIVRAVSSGRVSVLSVKVGSVVAVGANLATVERLEDQGEEMVAVLYAPGDSGPMIPLGAKVDLTVQSVPAQQFGVLRGHVVDVGKSPESREQISDFLSDSQLGEQFSAGGRPVKVTVELELSGDTRSGFAWSSVAGPPYSIDSRTQVSGVVHLATVRPIDWMVSS